MNAIRYFSKFGHSKQMAEAIEGIAGAKDLDDFRAFAASIK